MPRARSLRLFAPETPALAAQISELGAVREAMDPDQKTPWRRMDWLIVLATNAGTARWETASGISQHRRGTVFALAQGCEHRQVVGAAWWGTDYLLLQGPWTTAITKALQAQGGILPISMSQHARSDFVHLLDLIIAQPPGWDWQVASALAGLLGQLQTETQRESSGANLESRLAQVVDHDLAAPWSVPGLARHLDMSVSALAHRCVAECGLAPAAWLRRRRISQARELLLTGLTVTAVSERLGFANPYHFARVFRREIGHPPSAIRQSATRGPLSQP